MFVAKLFSQSAHKEPIFFNYKDPSRVELVKF